MYAFKHAKSTHESDEKCIHRPTVILIGKPEGKWPLWRPRRRWEDNIKLDHNDKGSEYVDWIHVAQDRAKVGGSCERNKRQGIS
jgi:hypothetical protein